MTYIECLGRLDDFFENQEHFWPNKRRNLDEYVALFEGQAIGSLQSHALLIVQLETWKSSNDSKPRWSNRTMIWLWHFQRHWYFWTVHAIRKICLKIQIEEQKWRLCSVRSKNDDPIEKEFHFPAKSTKRFVLQAEDSLERCIRNTRRLTLWLLLIVNWLLIEVQFLVELWIKTSKPSKRKEKKEN